MIADEIKKKIYFWSLIIAVGIGVLFAIWVFFINRGTIHITAQAPFNIQIENIKNVTCTSSDCSVVVAPGKYNISITKAGYTDEQRSIEVPFRGEYTENINLHFIPIFAEATEDQIANSPDELHPFPTQSNAQAIGLNDLPDNTTLFLDQTNRYASYILIDPTTTRQTLYLRHRKDDKTWENPITVTSFIRDLNQYEMSLSPNENFIVIIDRLSKNNEARLYVIDLTKKTRELALTEQKIDGIKWLPSGNSFVLSYRDPTILKDQLGVYSIMTKKLIPLDVLAPLANITFANDNDFFATTKQTVAGLKNNPDLEGKAISFEEPNQSEENTSLAVVEYSMDTNETRLVKNIDQLLLPEIIALSKDQKSIYMVQGGKTFVLRFQE